MDQKETLEASARAADFDGNGFALSCGRHNYQILADPDLAGERIQQISGRLRGRCAQADSSACIVSTHAFSYHIRLWTRCNFFQQPSSLHRAVRFFPLTVLRTPIMLNNCR